MAIGVDLAAVGGDQRRVRLGVRDPALLVKALAERGGSAPPRVQLARSGDLVLHVFLSHGHGLAHGFDLSGEFVELQGHRRLPSEDSKAL